MSRPDPDRRRFERFRAQSDFGELLGGMLCSGSAVFHPHVGVVLTQPRKAGGGIEGLSEVNHQLTKPGQRGGGLGDIGFRNESSQPDFSRREFTVLARVIDQRPSQLRGRRVKAQQSFPTDLFLDRRIKCNVNRVLDSIIELNPCLV